MILLILCFVVVLAAGIISLSSLFMYKQRFLAMILFVAFASILAVLFAAATVNSTIAAAQAAAAPTSIGQSLLHAAPIYIAIFGYAVLSLIFLASLNFAAMALQTVIFLLFAPHLFLYYRNYLTLSAMITLGGLLACSFVGAVRTILVYRGPRRGHSAAGLGKDARPLGLDTFSHGLFYVTILTLLASSGFCYDLVPFSEILAIGFVAAAAGVVGILRETDNYSLTIRERLRVA